MIKSTVIHTTLATLADVAKTIQKIELERNKFSASSGNIICLSTKRFDILPPILRIESPKGSLISINSCYIV
jgi:hypothetical protein